MAEPRRGYGYVQAIGTDMPVFWDVSWLMTADEAMAFQLWFDLKLQRGLLEFTLPLRTEFGDVEHTCRFLPESLLPASQDGQVWMYTAQIMARKLVRPAIYDEASDLIITLPDWSYWGSLLDQAVTAELPPWYLDILFTRSDTLDNRVTFTRASLATRVNSAGLIETVAANGPRFDYDPVTLQPKGLLIEEQRTNLLTYSEQLDNSAWVKTNATVTSNAITAPDGTLTADKLVENASKGYHFLAQYYSAASTYSFSFFAKVGERSRIYIDVFNSTDTQLSVMVDLSTGTSSNTSIVSCTSVGGGWYRVVAFNKAISVAISTRYGIFLDNGTSTNYTGDGASGIYIWGAQLEAGAFPTSYIPTTTAAATRAADVAVMTGSNFSSWYRQDEGTFFAEVTPAGVRTSDYTYLRIDDGTSSNRIQTGTGANATVANSFAINGGVSQGNNVVSVNPSLIGKTAFAFAANNAVAAANGSLSAVDTTVSIPTGINRLMLGRDDTSGYANTHIRRIAYYPRRLSNAELQSITA